MLGFIKNLLKKEQKTDEQIFAECRQRVKKYQEKLWKQNRRLLIHDVWHQNIIMRPDFKDAYDNKDLSIYGLHVKIATLFSKFLPEKWIMKIWLLQQGIK